MIKLKVHGLILSHLISLVVILVGSQPAMAFPFNMQSFFRNFVQGNNPFGSGQDGSITINGAANGPANPYVINTVASYLTANATSGATALALNSATGFSNNDEVLVIQMEGTDAGKMEFASVSSVSSNTLNLSSAITQSYTANDKVQVIRVMRYSSVTINSGGFITVNPYNAATRVGGVLVMKVSGTLTINDGGGGLSGHISAGGGYTNFASRGFAGGTSASGSGPGGGTSNGGGSNTSPANGDRLIMGSGGGSTSNTGGTGGGVVVVRANSLVLNGAIRSHGAQPSTGNAGGGSGGTISILANSISTSASCGQISASGGSGVGSGSTGGDGRNFIQYVSSLGCQTGSPSSNTNYMKVQLQ